LVKIPDFNSNNQLLSDLEGNNSNSQLLEGFLEAKVKDLEVLLKDSEVLLKGSVVPLKDLEDLVSLVE
jgi:hypothetical protein